MHHPGLTTPPFLVIPPGEGRICIYGSFYLRRRQIQEVFLHPNDETSLYQSYTFPVKKIKSSQELDF